MKRIYVGPPVVPQNEDEKALLDELLVALYGGTEKDEQKNGGTPFAGNEAHTSFERFVRASHSPVYKEFLLKK